MLSGIWVRLGLLVAAIVGVFLVFLAVIVVRGYFASPADPLIGKWEMVDGHDRVQISSDGSAKLTKHGGEVYVKWKRQPDGRLQFEARVQGGAWQEVYDVAISGDNLTMTKLGGLPINYKKVAVWKK